MYTGKWTAVAFVTLKQFCPIKQFDRDCKHVVNLLRLAKQTYNLNPVVKRLFRSLISRKLVEGKRYIYTGAQPGGAFGAFAPPEIFKTLHSNFDICRNFERIKMKFYIPIIFQKSYWNFSLSCSLIISLQDLSWDRLSYGKFCKWLVFNHKYAGTVNLWDSLKCSDF